MRDVKDVIVISIAAGLGLAIITNGTKVQPLLKEARLTWMGLIRTVSGTDRQQVRGV